MQSETAPTFNIPSFQVDLFLGTRKILCVGGIEAKVASFNLNTDIKKYTTKVNRTEIY